ncbi:MAG: hypothetical protein ACM3RX_06335 [Methanococcaceae archaeon]
MKKIIVFFLLLVSCSFAQRKTVFEGETENGGFGAAVVKFTPIKNNLGILVGGYGGWLINHSLLLGGGGFGLVNNIKANEDIQSIFSFPREPFLNFGYGGGIIEYYFSPNEILHASVSLLVGGGAVSYRDARMSDSYYSEFNDRNLDDGVFVLEPGLSGELNVLSYFKMGLSLSYRYVNGVTIYGLKNSDFSNFSVNLALKFGKF